MQPDMTEQTRRGRPPKSEGRARTSRDELLSMERKRRDDLDVLGRRLGVDPKILDLQNFRYRWINDDGVSRLFQMTENRDWHIVRKNGDIIADKDSDLGDAVSTVTGVLPNGQQQRTYLACKPRKWFDEDQKRKQDDLDEQLANLTRGLDRAGGEQADYIPHGGINLT
jgi:hypothetical protein